MSAITRSIRRIPPLAADLATALVVLAAHSAPFVLTVREADPVTGYTLGQYLPVLGLALPLVWRRRAPLAVLAAVMTATGAYLLNDPDTAPQPIPYALLVALYTVAAHGSPRTRTWALALLGCGAGIQLAGLVLNPPSADTTVRALVMYVAAWAMGRATANRHTYVLQLERDRQREAERAVERERAAIARDMHDVLGHAISLIVVQAEAGPLAVRPDPGRAEAAFDAIAETGREAMDQLRRLLGLLGSSSPGAPPTVARIEALVHSVDRAGQRATLTVHGTPRPLPADVEAAAYRVVQEALTNAVKHARASAVAVELDWRQDALMIGVTDGGRGHTGGSGYGLVGIRERAAACGGSASFGPGPGGRGFAVAVRLPGAAA
ncbi:sensor histidine kinase [Planomonospora venezuelensis]|uniref:histidine kinase n=1 Tax=Planomonospora venezuelensis TaxID=1999 RepID=A0A841D8A9_PLAVE|nr:histidine kinase [Planomonospora venezuelensis]MBB5965123.1 signal transduction histidine kinase [Planomonospora venezuelensis]GIN00400.1 two-component sensor histidine kinase [Planomonospora venezuelensis]